MMKNLNFEKPETFWETSILKLETSKNLNLIKNLKFEEKSEFG